MKKTLLASLGLATSLLAITQEQQIEIDRIFEGYRAKIESNQSLSESRKKSILNNLADKKKEIESQSDEEIAIYLDKNSGDSERIERAKQKEKELGIEEYKPTSSDDWLGWVFGSFGARFSSFFGGNSGGAYMGYATIGPKYNFSSGGSSFLRTKGFSLSLPIGFGAINTSGIKNDVDFALPIALEANYMFSDYMGFGISAGVRYTFSPQDIGNLHIMDFYAGFDLIYGAYIEAGYVFYSSQDVTLGNRTYSTDPLSGAITLNVGWRF
ncbi:hypothetical protein [Helicobacter brantae]|uniref:Uncharacterized protein n=1 Tax=Helicobacter brantae TaxID=375927 RepID=A0A3D8IWZ9_9HELI|nr:hypothetical protein [Helicobacter brantae]RDU69788.1 hypothetical protein CQA58_06510 [Helicobacter brantae]